MAQVETTLDPALRAFVEEQVGQIAECHKSAGGASRITWLIQAKERNCVLRVDSGDGPVAGTALTLGREATVYRALAGTNVRIPELIAETQGALLMEMARGRPELDHLDSAVRVQILDDYVDALADLHRIDASSGFAALDPPADAGSAAQQVMQLWEGIYRSRVRRPSPLARFASRWLKHNAPTTAERLVVCHGDVGPGNFMHDGERVTAMLDWEFVHVGDPMDDLAWLAFRGHHFIGDIGDFSAQLRRWQARTGFEVDKRRIAYYRIVVMYVWLISCLAALDNGAKNQDRFTYLNLISLMNVIMPRAMMEYAGVSPPEVDVDVQPHDSDLSEQISALVDLISLKWPPSDPGALYVGVMANQTLRLSQLGVSIREQNRDAVSALTGRSLDAADVDQVFDAWIVATPEQDDASAAVLYANGLRRVQADLALLPIVSKPFLPL